jgi:tetratricopeptide (TPR) repeat protein
MLLIASARDATSALLLNAANAQIARAARMPATARTQSLDHAEQWMHQARQIANEPRLSLARVRASVLGGAPDFAESNSVPDSIAQFWLGQAAWDAQEPAQAFAFWRAAGAFTYFINQARRAVDKHIWDEAEKFARIAIGIAPDDAEAHLILGTAISFQDINADEALRELERAFQLARDDELRATILSRHAEILAARGNARAARALFERAHEIAPIDARPRVGIALLQLGIGSHAEAGALLEQVIADSPWYVVAYSARAQIAEAANDARGAETWLHRGLVKNPNDARLLLPLGELYARQGRVAEAKTMLELALKNETRADGRAAILRALEKLK